MDEKDNALSQILDLLSLIPTFSATKDSVEKTKENGLLKNFSSKKLFKLKYKHYLCNIHSF